MASKKSPATTRELHKKVKKLTLGATDVLTNTVLYFLYVSGYMLTEGGKGPITVNRAFYKADRLLSEFDAKRLRDALHNLKRAGLITDHKQAQITKAGMRRLKNQFPVYEEKRAWDKNLYLIVYDVPVRYNTDRDILRESLKQLKAARIQNSVYLTPYNPRQVLKNIRRQKRLRGDVIVSTLDPEQGFGKVENIKKYLWDLYGLKEINERYAHFIGRRSGTSKEQARKNRLKIAFEYQSILKDDPQLPFELLPDEYLGDQAYLLLRKLLSQ